MLRPKARQQNNSQGFFSSHSLKPRLRKQKKTTLTKVLAAQPAAVTAQVHYPAVARW